VTQPAIICNHAGEPALGGWTCDFLAAPLWRIGKRFDRLKETGLLQRPDIALYQRQVGNVPIAAARLYTIGSSSNLVSSLSCQEYSGDKAAVAATPVEPTIVPRHAIRGSLVRLTPFLLISMRPRSGSGITFTGSATC
jgi:hypothetical protein